MSKFVESIFPFIKSPEDKDEAERIEKVVDLWFDLLWFKNDDKLKILTLYCFIPKQI